MKRIWRLFLAYFRLDDEAICEMSAGRDLHNDFHDYADSVFDSPLHFVTHRCVRCGKSFTI